MIDRSRSHFFRLSVALVVPLLVVGCDSANESCSGTLQTTDIMVGDGVEAQATSQVVVDYEGRLEDGTVFDEGTAVELNLSTVVQGFRDGVGGEREIVIPPDQAYGEVGIPGVIPSCETLTFDVTLISVAD